MTRSQLRWFRRWNRKIMARQYRLIRSRYSERDAHDANYGWGWWESGSISQVETKVYGKSVLISVIDGSNRTVTHEWDNLP